MGTSASADRTTEPFRSQFTETLDSATFPMCGPADLLSVMANGRDVFVVGDVELVALELALACGDHLSFPYESGDELVEDVTSALKQTYRP
jgi:hypothetical protein